MRLIDFFDRAVALYPENCFVKQGETSLTYRAAADWTQRIAAALQREGYGKGSRVSLWTPNDWRGLLAIFGLFRAGCVMAPVNARNAVAQNVEILQLTGAELLFYHPAFKAEAEQAAAACPRLTTSICLHDLEAWMAPEGSEAAPVDHDPQDLWALYSTSGTTGKSKAVQHTHLTNLVTCMDMLHAMQVHGPAVNLVVAPMTHFAGTFLFALTVTGSTHILMERVSPPEILAAIPREGVEILFLPPTVIYMLLAEPDLAKHDYTSLKTFAYAAAPMAPDKLKQAIAAFGPVMMNMFGQAEALGPLAFLPPEDHRPDAGDIWEARLRSIGRPSIMRQMAIMGDDGGLLPPGETGEVVIRSWGVTPGYLDNPEATAEAFRHGWYHTGDIGVADAEGYITLVDRKKDMIISGGFNVYSAEVEQAILAHPAVLECAVIGVPDEKWGEAVKAVIELKPDQLVTEAAVIALVKERLGSVKAPKTVEIWPELPRNATGKVLKRQIRDRYWDGRARKI